VTLKEIAKEAGVSVSTVSKVINSRDDSFAGKEVRDRIWAIVRRTGYQPNPNARALRHGKPGERAGPSASLCCILGRTGTADEGPFLSQVSRAVERQAIEQGCPVRFSYSVLTCGEKLMTSAAKKKIEAFTPDGVIAIGSFGPCATALLNRYYSKVVYIGRSDIQTDWDQVICSAYEAAELALSYLFSHRHKKIAYLGETENEDKFRAYRDFLAAHGLLFEERLVFRFAHNDEGGRQGAEALIKAAKNRPTAVFCACDAAAIALINGLKAARISVPGQISVTGIGNIEASGYVSPMLTTVGMPVWDIGAVAVQTLRSRMAQRHKTPLRIHLQNELMRRQSVAEIG